MTYLEKLRDPRWQKMAADVKYLAGWRCDTCDADDINLQVHHKIYIKGREPWEYPIDNFQCLCEFCHREVEDANQNLRQAFACVPYYDLNSLAFNFMRACESANPSLLVLAVNCTLDQVGKESVDA